MKSIAVIEYRNKAGFEKYLEKMDGGEFGKNGNPLRSIINAFEIGIVYEVESVCLCAGSTSASATLFTYAPGTMYIVGEPLYNYSWKLTFSGRDAKGHKYRFCITDASKWYRIK